MPPRRARSPLGIVVSAGPTREPLDDVRFLSSPSSGRMGFAVAAAARRAGHRVLLVAGPVDLPPPRGVETVPVTTARECPPPISRPTTRATSGLTDRKATGRPGLPSALVLSETRSPASNSDTTVPTLFALSPVCARSTRRLIGCSL